MMRPKRREARENSDGARRGDISHAALLGAEGDFAAQAAALRRFRFSIDGVETIRTDRDRDGPT